MNGYEKNYAYSDAQTAYDYDTEQTPVAKTATAYAPERRESFDNDFYYGGANDTFLKTDDLFTEKNAAAYKKKEETEDLVPSATTMQFLERKDNPFEDYREQGESATSKKFKINAKAKVLMAVYALVVLTIFALIIINTTLLKNVDKAVAAKQARIEVLTEETAALGKTLAQVSDDSVIEQKAAEMGMIKR